MIHSLLGIRKLEGFTEKDLDLTLSEKYVDSNVLFLKTGEIIVEESHSVKPEVFDIKAKESAKGIYYLDSATFSRWKEFVLSEISRKVEMEEVEEDEEKTARLDDTGVSRILERILYSGIRKGASDIYILPKPSGTQIRFRVDGRLETFETHPRYYSEYLVNKIKTLSKMDVAQKLIPQDGKMLLEIQGEVYEFRASVIPTIYGEDCVLRIQQTRNLFDQKLEDLGFEKHDLEVYRRNFKKPSGLILNVGATGQGKTTTFYLTIKELVDRFKGEKNIVTVEDPVEVKFEDILQIEVDDRQGRTFPVVLRSLLRHDPDVILIGEIRDEETAEIGVRASITGHLVLATLHANDSFNAITRLRDLGLSDQLIASTLNCILSQRLVRKLCDCKRKIKTPSFLKAEGITADFVYEPAGCERCGHTGYRGRTAVIEVLELDEELKTAVAEGVNEIGLKKMARGKGFTNLWMNALKKIEKGITSFEEVRLIVKKDSVLNESRQTTGMELGKIFYPEEKIRVEVKNRKGYLFDLSSKGVSFVFDEIFFLTIDVPVDVNIGGSSVTFIPKSYKKYSDKFVVGGIYRGDLTYLIER